MGHAGAQALGLERTSGLAATAEEAEDETQEASLTWGCLRAAEMQLLEEGGAAAVALAETVGGLFVIPSPYQ